MARLSRIDAAFAAGAGVAWLALSLWKSEPIVDRFFVAVLMTCLLYLLRLGTLAWLGARREQSRAVGVQRLHPQEVALAAVMEERARLASDIARCLRETMAEVQADCRDATGPDPVPALLRIQAHTRRATSELRRQLGLLREGDVTEGGSCPDVGAGATNGLGRRDLLWGAAIATLALIEVTAYVVTDGYGDGSVFTLPGSVVLSVVAAASIALRRTAPVVASLWCGAAFGLGTLLGAPVGGGFWAIATVGGLAWTLAATALADRATRLTWAALTGMVLHSRLVDDPDNVFIFALLIGVATVLGLAVRLNRGRTHRATASARTHEETLAQATRLAVGQERQRFAREIHDVVSHAVGLIAMQAGAAEMSWPHDPDTTRRSVDVIASTAAATLAEIDRLVPGAGAAQGPRLEDLVERIRAAGTSVRLVKDGVPGPALAPLVYRIMQEGLTNTVRHAPGAAVTVVLRSGQDHLDVVVADDGPGPDEHHQPGYGLVGLEERVTQAGGSLTAGLGPGGRGFELHARVPARTVQAAP